MMIVSVLKIQPTRTITWYSSRQAVLRASRPSFAAGLSCSLQLTVMGVRFYQVVPWFPLAA